MADQTDNKINSKIDNPMDNTATVQAPYEAFADQAFVTLCRHTPELVAAMGLSRLPEFADLNGGLNDYSIAGAEQRGRLLAQLYGQHRAYDRSRLSAAEQLSYDVFSFFIDYLPFEPWVGAQGQPFALHSYPVRHIDGAPIETFTLLANFHDIRGPADAEAYLSRLQQLTVMFSDLDAGLHYRQARQLSPPRSALAIVAGELRALLGAGCADSNLLSSFAAKIAAVEAIGPRARTRYLQQAQDILAEFYRGPLPQLYATINSIRGSASDAIGVWRLPDGEAFYQYAMTRQLSIGMTPDELFALGESEVARLKSELVDDLAALGTRVSAARAQELAGALAAALRDDSATARDTARRRQEILDYYSDLVAATEKNMRPFFGRYPSAACVVKATDRHWEQQRTTAYYPPSASGDYPGLFELSLPRELTKPPWSRNTMAYHEAFPGHHLQLSLAQELQHLPLFRRAFINAAYLEGWAKYAERLPFETGVDSDPRYELQRKSQELISASNLMLDVGIHRRRWNREQAIAFSRQHGLTDTGMATYLVDRISVAPAQVTAYSVGLALMRKLRRQLQQAQGSDFSLASFHDRILLEGALPLELLEFRVNALSTASAPVHRS